MKTEHALVTVRDAACLLKADGFDDEYMDLRQAADVLEAALAARRVSSRYADILRKLRACLASQDWYQEVEALDAALAALGEGEA